MYIIKGKVKKGNQRGATLGFPTANISLHQQIPEGIYISKLKYSGSEYPGLTFIGKAETFNESTYQAETYLLDAKLDLYGKLVEVQLLAKIRDSQKFDNELELIKAMKKDEEKAREYFKK